MKKNTITMYALLMLLVVTNSSCKKGGDSDPNGKVGNGTATLVVSNSASTTYTINGSCTFNDFTSSINIVDATTGTNICSVLLNEALPATTKTYTLVKSDINDENVNHATMDFSLITNSSITDWSSDNSSGTVTLNVNGNAINCTFNNIVLQPSAFYNTGELANPGRCTATLTVYRN
jgi:hypothetical protein